METVSVRREVVLEAAREEVWAALTEADRLAQWFANEVELELVPGGEGTFRWTNGEERRAVVEDVDPGRRLAFRWLDEEGHETSVELTLSEAEDGTRLTVEETAVAAPRASARRSFVPDWIWALELGALAAALGVPAFA